MAKRTILLTGADGMLGRSLTPLLQRAGTVDTPGLDQFDLTRPETILETFEACHPDLVIHLAAEARVDYCEEHPEAAFGINATGTAAVAMACRELSARLVTMSSDYVFDGRRRVPYSEDQTPAPLNVYGRSKEEAERATMERVEDSLVVRSSSLYGAHGRHFVGAILGAARRGEPLRVVADQTHSPTYVGHLAPALAQAALSDLAGILHLSGEGSCTWYEFAETILSLSGQKVSCRPITSAEAGRPAPRPAYSVLDGALAGRSLGIHLPHWRDALGEYMEREGR